MSRTKKKATILTLLVGLFALMLFAVTLLIKPSNTANAEEWNGSAIESEYSLGTEFTVPDYSVTVSGTTAQASSSLIYPNGNATAKKTVVLDEMGQYSLVYTAKVNGKAYSETYSFSVTEKLVKYSSSDTSVTYGKWEHADTRYGLMVRLAAGDTLTFSSLIDVSDVTQKDSLVELLVTPDIIGVNDFNRMIFTFTDALDPSVYLKVTARSNGVYSPYRSWLLAGGNGQPLKGFEEELRKVHTANEYGSKVRHSFSAQNPDPGVGRFEERTLNLSYDAESLSLYAGRTFVMDFDNPAYFQTMWNGFPSGYAKLSITCDLYNNATANFCVFGVRGTEISESTATANFVDKDVPEIKVNTEYDSMPLAKVGLGYSVPTATAIDYVSGECEVKTYVYYNYASPNNAVLVPYENGLFRVDRQGSYAIVYEATDKSGNVAKEVLWVEAKNEVALPTVNFDTTGVTTSGVLGEWFEVPEASATATSGNATVVITATSADGKVYEVTDGGFRAETEGTYTVKATATDYIGQTKDSASYTVTVTRGDKPVFVDDDPLPKYFISGYSYKLGEYYANDYTSGSLVRKLANAEITDKNGTYTVNAGETFRPTVSNNGDKVKVVYKCGNATLEKNVMTIVAFEGADQKLNLENYVITQGVTATRNANNMTISATAATGGWEFANSLIAQNFSAIIAGVGTANNYSALRVVLEDSLDGSCAVEARLVDRGTYSEFVVGDQVIRVSKALASGKEITIGFDGKDFTIDSTAVSTTKTVSGEEFNGFASNKVYCSIYFENAVAGEAAYVISELCGQPMTHAARDRLTPVLAMLGKRSDPCVINEVKVIPAVVIADVLTPDVKAYLSVYGADGKIVKDVNGAMLDSVDPSKEYTIQLDQYGRYSVEYNMADTNEGVVTYYSYVIVVEDNAAPEITLLNSVSKTAKLNDTLVMPDFTATDNVTAEENLTVMRFVISPTGEMIYLTNGSNSIVATKLGNYEFVIMVMDEAGNFVTESIVINVEA